MEEPPSKDESNAPAGAQNPNHLFGGVDSISSLPDKMLHHIIPTNVAITTSVSCPNTPYLSFPHLKSSLEWIHETLASYTAPKIMRFHLYVDSETVKASERCNHVDSLIKFAIAYNVDKLSLVLNAESLRLRRLDLEFFNSSPRKCHIVAPHISYLRMIDSTQKYSLVDVSSLIEANIDTIYFLPRFWCTQDDPSKYPSKDDYQLMMQTMLENLQNVEKLTVVLSFLQMLSVAEFHGVPFPTLKVKTLTLKTTILQSAEKYVNRYLDPQDPQDISFRLRQIAKPDLVALFVELLLRNTRTLKTLVIQLRSCLNTSNYDELSQIALTLSHKNKVSIVLK
ncbi:LOW QUALITY PROTEIN: hypothetical protein HID58_086009 [Brassica napus]|uniref:FBD domain-containing protein n=1 Tax=Brassica napus TaxID=3708 RepID=A0ABQ7XPD9_BRANA|nr:LOW QUALITY PROTEIN: hypothetical protein HID58_086009 [Brassica napus]